MGNRKNIGFTRMLIEANGFAAQQLTAWLFTPGMLFRSADKWWGDGGRRDYPHEGLDFALYRDAAGAIKSLEQGTRIPAMAAGVVRSVFSDYLGQAIVVEHTEPEADRRRRISIYAHTDPLTGIQPGAIVTNGDVIAAIADTGRSKANIRPHLHYTLGQLTGSVDFDHFVWNWMRDPNRITLLDPLPIIDWPHRVLWTPLQGHPSGSTKAPRQSGE